MRRLLLPLLSLLLTACFQEDYIHGKRTITTVSHSLPERVAGLQCDLPGAYIRIINAPQESLFVAVDSNMHSYIDITLNSAGTLRIAKNVEHILNWSSCSLLIPLPYAPQSLFVRGCTTVVDSTLTGVQQLVLKAGALCSLKIEQPTLKLATTDAALALHGYADTLKLRHFSGDLDLSALQSYRTDFTQGKHTTLQLSVEKFLRGTMGKESTLLVHGSALVEVTKGVGAVVEYR